MIDAALRDRDDTIYRRHQAGEQIKLIARAFALDPRHVSRIVGRERKDRQIAAEAAARAARERDAERVPGKYGGFQPIALDAALRAEIEAAKREAPYALPFKGRID